MTAVARAVVRKALAELKRYLRVYVLQTLASTPRSRRPSRDDIQALLCTMLDNWEAVLAAKLSLTVRHYVFEFKDIRNRWAHEEAFSPDEAHRADDTARLLAKAIDAPRAVLDSLAALAVEAETSIATLNPALRIRVDQPRVEKQIYAR